MTKSEYLTKIYTSEDQFQAATFQFINHNYPKLRKLIFHVPNESATSNLMRMKLTAMGLTSGIPDIVCICPAFGIELKLPKGIQSDKQKLVEQIWKRAGIPYFLCHNSSEVVFCIENVLI